MDYYDRRGVEDTVHFAICSADAPFTRAGRREIGKFLLALPIVVLLMIGLVYVVFGRWPW